MYLINRIVFYSLIIAVLALGPLVYSDLLQKSIKSNERAYISGNFDFHRARDPQDKNSEALYWFIQGIDHERN